MSSTSFWGWNAKRCLSTTFYVVLGSVYTTQCFSGCAQIIEPAGECDELVRTDDVKAFLKHVTQFDKSFRKVALKSKKRPDGSALRRWSIDSLSINFIKRFKWDCFFGKELKFRITADWQKSNFSLLIAFASLSLQWSSTNDGINYRNH